MMMTVVQRNLLNRCIVRVKVLLRRLIELLLSALIDYLVLSLFPFLILIETRALVASRRYNLLIFLSIEKILSSF